MIPLCSLSCPGDDLRSLCRRRAEITRVGDNAAAPKIQAISIPTGLHGTIAIGTPGSVIGTGDIEKIEFVVGEREVPAA